MSRSRCWWSSRFIAQLSLVVLCSTMTLSSERCEFPAYMTRMDWRTQVAVRRADALWRFPSRSQAELRDYRPEQRGRISLFNCRTAVSDDTFLTSIAGSDDGSTSPSTSSYQCLRFIRRSDFVVQLAKSDVYDAYRPELCSDPTRLAVQDLVLVGSPKYDSLHLVTDTIGCGLAGRYWLSVVDKSTGCRDTFLRPMLEADCISPGEGVLIDFRQPTCAIAAGTATLYNLVCRGSWTQSGFIYSVLDDNKSPLATLWMLKIPEVVSGPMTAYLMSSLTTGSASTADVAELSLTPASFPTLCENEASGCDVGSDCADDAKELHCQKTCDACAVTTSNGLSYQFNESYHGQWLDVSHRNADDQEANRVVTVCV